MRARMQAPNRGDEGVSIWTNENHAKYNRYHLRYPSNLTGEKWTVIEPLIPPARRGGRQRSADKRGAMSGIMDVLTSGCQWRSIPSDPLPRATVVHYFSLWRLATPVGMVPMLQTMLADSGDTGLTPKGGPPALPGWQ
jgi:transposase